ncbi:MAG: KaiC domain-containing protein [Halobacteriaceae archaeon]
MNDEDTPFEGDESQSQQTNDEESDVTGGEDGELFDEDFSNELQEAGEEITDVESSTEEFEEEYHDDIARIDLGIDGLDEMIQGGVPKRSLLTTIGGAGTGKTTFGLQFLHKGINEGKRGVFITLEESRDRIIQTANTSGWDFSQAIQNDNLAVIEIDPIEMANSLQSIRNELPGLIREFNADRLVLDSVSLLEMMYDDQGARRTEIYDFTESLKQAGVTTLLTSEASENNPYASRHGIIEYLTDGVFILQYVRPEDFRETRLAIEVQKIRNSNHSRATKPYEITNQGINVYQQATIF